MVGKTGMGKSTMLEHIIMQQIESGGGVCFLDPHGESSEKILNNIPDNRIEDVFYFNPANQNNVAGINVLDTRSKKTTVVTAEIVRMFRHNFGDSWGPRLQWILTNAVASLLEHGNCTLLGINRMLMEENFRKRILSRVRDREVRQFWNFFEGWTKSQRLEAIGSVLNKIGAVTADNQIRRIIGQVKSTFDFETCMDKKRIVIANLNKGEIGGDQAQMLGSIIVSKMMIEALHRKKENRHIPYLFVVDEFPNFGTDAFIEMVSEARKYGLALVVAHQYTHQIESKMRYSLIGNVGTLVSFQVGADDATLLKNELEFHQEKQLMDLGQYKIRIKTDTARTANTIEWKGEEEDWSRLETVERVSNRWFTRPTENVDAKLHEFYKDADIERILKPKHVNMGKKPRNDSVRL